MDILHSMLLGLHVALGFVALILFWIPAFSRKGGAVHRRVGRWYAWSMYGVSASGALLSLLALLIPVVWLGGWTREHLEEIRDTYQFLLYLSLLTFVTVYRGIAVLRAREDRRRLRHWRYLAWPVLLVLASVAEMAWGLIRDLVLSVVFSAVGFGTGIPMLRYVLRREVTAREWSVEHLGAMIGSGIAAHTAFFAFGGRTLLGLEGALQMVAWIAPGVIGTAFIIVLSRRYRHAARVARAGGQD